jgi:hypothetical protein
MTAPGEALVDEGVMGLLSAELVRRYVRARYIGPVLERLYDTAMGVQKFGYANDSGKLIEVGASAAIQVRAMTALVEIGVPRALGLVDSTGQELPGVMALPEWDLESARMQAHGDKYIGEGRIVTNGPETVNNDGSQQEPSVVAEGLPVEAPSSDPPDDEQFEYVVVEETGDGSLAAGPTIPPTPASGGTRDLALQILARRRARNGSNGNGRRGTNGDGTDG